MAKQKPKQTSNSKLIRVALYMRVSSDEQAKNGDSLRDQEESGMKYINEHSNMILQDVYVDDGISGQKLQRDDFTRLMTHVKQREIDFIIFTKLDRWFRSLRHYLNTQATLEECDVSWLAINQPFFDTSTPYGRAFVAQSMTWAELEAQNGAIRIQDVFRNKVAHGEVITGKVPRGYRIENKHLVLSDEAPIIYDCIMYFARIQSLHGTLSYMRDKYNIVMTLDNLKKSILKNSKYIGKYRGNDSYCPRLISDDTFEQIQDVLRRNINIKSNQRYSYIFSGLLVCAECGYKMSGCHINVLSTKKNGNVYRYKYPAYECKQHRAYTKCLNGGEIREVRIEEYLLEHVREELNKYILYETETGKVVDNRDIKSKINRKMERLKELYVNEMISLDEYKIDLCKYREQLEQLPDVKQPVKDFTALKQLLNCDFETLYQTFELLEKRIFWRSIIKEIRVPKSQNRHREYEIIFLQ